MGFGNEKFITDDTVKKLNETDESATDDTKDIPRDEIRVFSPNGLVSSYPTEAAARKAAKEAQENRN